MSAMTADDVKLFLAKRKEAFVLRDVDALGALYADDAVVESPAGGGTTKGRQTVENIYRSWLDAFPDFTLEDEEYVIEGGSVAHFVRAVGTNAGGFMGLPATGKRFHINLAYLFTVENGKIT